MKIIKSSPIFEKIIKKNNLQTCMDLLQYILYSFYFTDAMMHKQGIIYEIESYQKRTILRFKYFFSKLLKVIATKEKKELLKILREKNEKYRKKYYHEIENEDDIEDAHINRMKAAVTPYEKVESFVSVEQARFWRAILETLEDNEERIKEKWDDFFVLKSLYLSVMHEGFRKKLKEYGYQIKKEKVVKYLKKKRKKIK